eukprot:TRINITY_DN16929_c0_g1_i1.p1 TRINITY_DN16929_c0_g1~~TRINITY_DN16929_c0_g1_i1.p1  ORF type:complete len:485 (-),score=94.21 TRINITY_DN16929_c0_g1_i1:29-1429(-)
MADTTTTRRRQSSARPTPNSRKKVLLRSQLSALRLLPDVQPQSNTSSTAGSRHSNASQSPPPTLRQQSSLRELATIASEKASIAFNDTALKATSRTVAADLPDQDFAERLKHRIAQNEKLSYFSSFVVAHSGFIASFNSAAKLVDHLELQAHRSGSVPLWVDIESSSLDDLELIAKCLNVHALTLRTCLRSSARQKLELFPNYLFLVLDTMHHHHYCPDKSGMINIIYFPQMVLTIHKLPAFAIDIARERVHTQISEWKQVKTGAIDVLNCVVESLCDIDDPVLNGFNDLLSDLDTQFLEIAEKTPAFQRVVLLREMSALRKQLLEYEQLLNEKKEVISLLATEHENLSSTFLRGTYFRDELDHVLDMSQRMKNQIASAALLESKFLSKVKNVTSKKSKEHLNVMQIMAVVVTVALPIEIIAQAFQMQTPLPMMDLQNFEGFYLILAGIAVVVGSIFTLTYYKLLK